MLNPEGYAALTHVYDASLNLGRWKRALDAVTKSLDARAIALLIRGPDPSAKDLTMLNSKYLDFTRSVSGLYYGLRFSHLQKPDWDYLSRQPAHQLTTDDEIGVPTSELDARADYRFLHEKLGVRRRLGVKLNNDKVWFDAMSIAFDGCHDRIPADALRSILPLLPHMTKSVEIGRTFSQLKSRYASVLNALDRVRVGLAIALPSGEIIIANDETQRIFALKDGLSKSADGHLRCHESDQNSEIQAHIVAAANTARGEGDRAESLMALRRPSNAEPFLVDIAPLSDTASNAETGLQGALITIIDPERIPHLKMTRFTTLYGLTPAEAEVCGLILHGLSVNEIAESRNTTPITTKNQINSVLSKTGAAKRADLIRLVIRVLPPVG